MRLRAEEPGGDRKAEEPEPEDTEGFGLLTAEGFGA